MLDVALFCLSMMGSNVTDYVREAHRTLKLDGWLHIYEPTARFSDREAFARSLRALGFGNIEVNDVGAFSHVSARKTEHHRQANAEVSGLGG
jgi:predicted SAM-dependent methyltransferase